MNPSQQAKAQQAIRAGEQHHAAGNLPAAEQCYLEAQRLQPGNPHIHHVLGMIAIARGDGPAAVERFGTALQCKPNEATIQNQLAQALQLVGREEEALVVARASVASGGGPDAQYILALILCRQRKFDEALVESERALALRPGGVDEMLLLSALYPALGQWDKARQMADAAVQAHPTVPETQRNHALACLIEGDMKPGWEAFEHRPELKPPAGTTLWRGEDLAGKTILLYGEGGFGDTIQFVRYVPLVKARTGKVVLACAPELLDLLRSSVTVDQLIPQNEPWPACDYVCPLAGLPQRFETTLETIPRDVPYLRPDLSKVEAWKPYIPTDRSLNVGLIWAGSNVADKQRSRTLLTFAPLAEIPGVRFFSLQKGAESWQAAAGFEGLEVIDLMPRVRDFADLAGVIENLDLVIAIDTSVAHLAGAMGKPIWVLIPAVADFRWMLERADSPWYPTMRLYRQTRRSDWTEPVARLASDLRQLQSEKSK